MATFSPDVRGYYADTEYHSMSMLQRFAAMLARFTTMPIHVSSRSPLLICCISLFSELPEETNPIKGREMRGRYQARLK